MPNNALSWDEFKLAISNLRANTPPHAPLLFRGQASDQWDLETTLERTNHSDYVSDYYKLILRIRPEIETTTNLKWDDDLNRFQIEKMLLEYDAFNSTLGHLPHYAYMTYLRHHGFPSPLLDWSQSPYVAAYFAFRKPEAEHVKIFAYCERTLPYKTSSSDDPQIWQYGPFVRAHRRHFAQQSQYTICVQYSEHDGWRFKPHSSVFERNAKTQDVIRQYTIRASERSKVLRELGDYNLNAFSLFGSEESLMEMLSIREESRGDDTRLFTAVLKPAPGIKIKIIDD